jgi:antitoxin component YwqK of YwqJK toxin-antitoxin module
MWPGRLMRRRVAQVVAAMSVFAGGSTGVSQDALAADAAKDMTPLQPMVMLNHANGQPSVVAFMRGEERVRDERYDEAGVRVADVLYSEGGHRAAWRTYWPAGGLQASYFAIDGKKEGQEWRYDVAGKKIAIVNFKNGLREGTQFEFLPTGEKRSELRFKAGDPEGPMTLFYPTGEREAVVNIVNERKHGTQVEYDKAGTVRAEVPHHFGVMDGVATYFDEKGAKFSTVRYEQGTPRGEETRFYPSGKVKMTMPFADGEHHGLATLYTPEGFKQSEIPFVHGHVSGFDRRYNPLGRMTTAVKYQDDQPAGVILTFFPSHYLDSERVYKNLDRMDGKEVRYFDAGPSDVTPVTADPDKPAHSAKLMEVPIEADKKQGNAWTYDREGHLVSKFSYDHDKRHGLESRYYPPDKGPAVKQAEYLWQNDRLVGMARTWWKNGNKQSEFPFEDGHGSGMETRWDINGRVQFRVPLVQGQKQGMAELYDPKSGALLAKIHYEKDIQDGDEERYDAKGKVRLIYQWHNGRLVGAVTPKRKTIELAHYLTPEELESLSDVKALENPETLIARAKSWRQQNAEQQQREALQAGALAIRAGTVETYFKDAPDKIQSKFPENGNGQEVQYHKNGTPQIVVPLVEGQRNGLARIYDETGTLWAIVPFLHGSKHGIEVRYARTGEKMAEYPYKMDQPTGMARTWYSDGTLQSEYNFAPVGRGTEVQFHRNGEVRLHIPLVDGRRQGLATIYTETGVKWAEVPYLLGQRHGTEVRFDAEGHRIREIVWQNGKQVSDAPVAVH